MTVMHMDMRDTVATLHKCLAVIVPYACQICRGCACADKIEAAKASAAAGEKPKEQEAADEDDASDMHR